MTKRRRSRWRVWRLVPYLVVLALAVGVAGKYWIAPAMIRREIRLALEDSWAGEVTVGDVKVDLGGSVAVGGITLRDELGRTWARVQDVTVGLTDWPGLKPKVAEVTVETLRLSAWSRDGRVQWPRKPPGPDSKPTSGQAMKDYLALRSGQLKHVWVRVEDEAGWSVDLEDMGMSLAREEGQYRAALTRGPRGTLRGLAGPGGAEEIDLALDTGAGPLAIVASADPDTLAGSVRVELERQVSRREGGWLLSLAGADGSLAPAGQVTASVTLAGTLRDPASLRASGTVRLAGVQLDAAGSEVAGCEEVLIELDGLTARVTRGLVQAEPGQADLAGTSLTYDPAAAKWQGQLAADVVLPVQAPRARPVGGNAKEFWSAYPWLAQLRGRAKLTGPMRLWPGGGDLVRFEPGGGVDLEMQFAPAPALGAGPGKPGSGPAVRRLRVRGQVGGQVAIRNTGQPAGEVRLARGEAWCERGMIAREMDVAAQWTDWLTWRVLRGRASAGVGEPVLDASTVRYDPVTNRLHVGLKLQADLYPAGRKEPGAVADWVPQLADLAGKVELAGPVTIDLSRASPSVQVGLAGQFDVWGDTTLPFFQPPGTAPDKAGATASPAASARQRLRARGQIDAALTLANLADPPRHWLPRGTIEIRRGDLHTPEGWICRELDLAAAVTGWSARVDRCSAVTDMLSARLTEAAVQYDWDAERFLIHLAGTGQVHADRRPGGFWTRRVLVDLLGAQRAAGAVALAGPIVLPIETFGLPGSSRPVPGPSRPVAYDLHGTLGLSDLLLAPPAALQLTDVRSNMLRLASGRVELLRAVGRCYGGLVRTDLWVLDRADKSTVLTGRVEARDVDAARLHRALGPDWWADKPLSSGKLLASGEFAMRVDGTSDFNARTLNLRARTMLDDSDVWQVPILDGLFSHLSLGKSRSDAQLDMTMTGRMMTIQSARVASPTTALVAEPGGTVDLARKEVDVYVAVVPLKQARNLLGGVPVLKILFSAGDKLLRARVKGNWESPENKKDPARLVTSKPLEKLADNMLDAIKEIGKGGGQLGMEIFQPIGNLLDEIK